MLDFQLTTLLYCPTTWLIDWLIEKKHVKQFVCGFSPLNQYWTIVSIKIKYKNKIPHICIVIYLWHKTQDAVFNCIILHTGTLWEISLVTTIYTMWWAGPCKLRSDLPSSLPGWKAGLAPGYKPGVYAGAYPTGNPASMIRTEKKKKREMMTD